MEDKKTVPLSTILEKLHVKFGINISSAAKYDELAAPHEEGARRLGNARSVLQLLAKAKHQNEMAGLCDELFVDSTAALYLTFSGLDVPACMLARRSLELGLVLVCYWDSPVDYWAWKSHDEDISFSKLHSYISSDGYISFLTEEGKETTEKFVDVVKHMPDLYSKLSNVVHPKIYNFEITSNDVFGISDSELRETLKRIKSVQDCLLSILETRFPEMKN
ncbi:MAG: hypothetical protein WC742_15065 [Gallionellaceae bacterium]